MNTPGTNRDAPPAFMQRTACQGAILVKDGMYHVDERKYHPDCYDHLLEGLMPLRGRALARVLSTRPAATRSGHSTT
jgi:hypothetical protein